LKGESRRSPALVVLFNRQTLRIEEREAILRAVVLRVPRGWDARGRLRAGAAALYFRRGGAAQKVVSKTERERSSQTCHYDEDLSHCA